MSLDLFFDYLAVRLNGEKAEGQGFVLNWIFRDGDHPTEGRRYVLTLQNCALTYLAERQSDRPDATVTLARPVLDRLVLRELTIDEAIDQGLVAIEGDRAAVARLFGLLDDFALMFDVIEPRR
jgi:alkyl sulfatase BDS1-like metallo-beta-lactamase superfamily hydrolase